jgi:hypothetical protein
VNPYRKTKTSGYKAKKIPANISVYREFHIPVFEYNTIQYNTIQYNTIDSIYNGLINLT